MDYRFQEYRQMKATRYQGIIGLCLLLGLAATVFAAIKRDKAAPAVLAAPASTPVTTDGTTPQPFSTPILRGDGPGQAVSVNISGWKGMQLVSTIKEGAGNCHIWGEAKLIAKDGSETPLSKLTPASVTVGWGQLLVDKNWQKNPLRVGDKEFKYGIWVHGNSNVSYALDGKYERFEAWAGLDKDRAKGAAQFQVLPGLNSAVAAETPAAPLDEMQSQFMTLQHDIRNRAMFAKVANETLRRDALILETDRDPADVVLRRTAALLADLLKTDAASKLADVGKQLLQLQDLNSKTDIKDAPARYKLFTDVCRLRRQIAFANPLLNFDKLLFVKHHRALYNHMCDQYYGITARPGGGVFLLANPFSDSPKEQDILAESTVQNGRLKGQKISGPAECPANLHYNGVGTLTGGETKGGSFIALDLSYDAKEILFSFVECTGDRTHSFHTDPTRGHWAEGRSYHIFRAGVDGTNLRQLTDGTWNDIDPVFLPNGRIAFISERRGGYLRCGRVCPNYNLYEMAGDGSDMNCLSLHETNEWHPSVTNDGRIVYTRWDYVDRFGCTAHHPWITSLDGRDARAVHGNFSPRQARPDMELDTRAIPGSHKFVASAVPHHGQAYGTLVLIDPHVADDDALGPVQRITPDVGFPESQGGLEAYGTPWPLSEDYYLCVYDAGIASKREGRNGRGDYGIYLVDSFGNKELIYRDANIASLCPIPLRPTPTPPVPALAANPVGKYNPAAAPADQQKPGEGTLACINVYDSLKPWPEGTKIKSLRVMQVLPMSVPSGGPPHNTGVRIALAGDSVVAVRYVLGTVPVEEDGSVYFSAPANREMFFQALDEKGLAIQSMRSAAYLRSGENLVCQGCHEPKNTAPAVPAAAPLALRREPSRFKPDVEGSNPFSYPLLVQPVLERNCVPCHSKPENIKKAPNLGKEPIKNNWYASYNSLVPKYAFTSYGDNLRTTPGKFGAKASALYQMLSKGHNGVKLSDEDMHRITLWLDCSSMFYGVYEKEGGQIQLKGGTAKPTLE